MRNKIIVSGGSGFLGKNLIRYLTRSNVEEMSRDELSTVTSLSNECEVVIHLAGKAHDLKKTANPDDYYKINFELTKKLYDAFLKSDAKKFIFISSVKAAADIVDGILTEETAPNPQTHYGKSKLMAEIYIQNQPLPEGKSYYILRPCMIHGPGNKGNLNLLYKFVQKGVPYPLGAYDNRRSFLSVENLCYVISQLIGERNIPSGIYNVADDLPLSTKEVVKLLYLAINKKPKIIYFPTSFVARVAKLGDLLRLPFNSERLQKMTENYIVSNQKIKETLQIELPLSAVDGLKITAKSFNL